MKNEMLLYFFASVIMTFALTALITRAIIPKLKSIKLGQKILDIGPRWHKSKEGTPTMGGIAFILASLITTVTVGIFAAYRGKFDSFGKVACVTGMIVCSGLFCSTHVKNPLSVTIISNLSASRMRDCAHGKSSRCSR